MEQPLLCGFSDFINLIKFSGMFFVDKDATWAVK